jgi:hypothetical protein
VDNTMRAFLHTTARTALTLIASSALATAAEVRVLTVGSTHVAAKAIAAESGLNSSALDAINAANAAIDRQTRRK